VSESYCTLQAIIEYGKDFKRLLPYYKFTGSKFCQNVGPISSEGKNFHHREFIYTVSGKKEATVFLGITLDKFRHSFIIFNGPPATTKANNNVVNFLIKRLILAIDHLLFRNSFIRHLAKGSVGVSRDCPNFLGTPYYLRNR